MRASALRADAPPPSRAPCRRYGPAHWRPRAPRDARLAERDVQRVQELQRIAVAVLHAVRAASDVRADARQLAGKTGAIEHLDVVALEAGLREQRIERRDSMVELARREAHVNATGLRVRDVDARFALEFGGEPRSQRAQAERDRGADEPVANNRNLVTTCPMFSYAGTQRSAAPPGSRPRSPSSRGRRRRRRIGARRRRTRPPHASRAVRRRSARAGNSVRDA
jgi:hypothetical protein